MPAGALALRDVALFVCFFNFISSRRNAISLHLSGSSCSSSLLVRFRTACCFFFSCLRRRAVDSPKKHKKKERRHLSLFYSSLFVFVTSTAMKRSDYHDRPKRPPPPVRRADACVPISRCKGPWYKSSDSSLLRHLSPEKPVQ